MSFQALFDHSSLGIIISNIEGVIEKANPFAARMFGYDPGELNGKMIEALVPAHIREKHVHYREQYNKNPQPRAMGSNFNLLAVKRNGDQFPVEISLSFFVAEGRRQIVSFVNDITERKRAENALKKLTEELEQKVNERTRELSDALTELSHTNQGLKQEMEHRKRVEAQIRSTLEKEKELSELKSRFVSMASHEFRTPLGGIMTSASLIAKYPTTEDASKREKHIQTIKKSVKNLTAILNDFLSIDKLDQGVVSVRPVNFELPAFLEEMVAETGDVLDKGHTLVLKHEVPQLAVTQDKEILRNVMTNLISNAVKYSPNGGEILISTTLNNGTVSVSIKDSGIGIPAEDQKHLFERFFRANNVTAVQGTGLGLNIVRRYLELMGGGITFTSKENVGTTFTISFPQELRS